MQGARTCGCGKRLSAPLALLITSTLALSTAHAEFAGDADVQAAARAFQAAQRAQLAGDAGEAARLYELADSIAPAPEALRSAIRAYVAAESPARAATLALAAQRRYPEDTEALGLSSEVLAQHAPALGRLAVRCERACALLCDGQALQTEPATELEFFVTPGAHAIEARWGGAGARTQSLELAAGELRELSFEAPALPAELPAGEPLPGPSKAAAVLAAPPPPTPVKEAKRLPPEWFWTAAGLTTLSGAAALISGLDTLDRQADYERAPTRAAYDSGKASELRTNLLIGGTAALLVASGLLFAFADFEDDGEQISPSLAATPHSALLLLRRSFR